LVDGINERLQRQRNIGVRLAQRNRDGRQWLIEVRGPDPTPRGLFFAGHEDVVGALWKRIEHRHALATAKQVDFDEVDSSLQQYVSLALVQQPALESRFLIGWCQHFDPSYQARFRVKLQDVEVKLLVRFGDESPHASWRILVYFDDSRRIRCECPQ